MKCSLVGVSDVPLVTFRAKQVSVHDALSLVCKICDLQWSVENSVVMVERKK